MAGRSVLGQWLLCLSVWSSPLQAQVIRGTASPLSPPTCISRAPASDATLLRVERLLDHLLQANQALLHQDLSRVQICLSLEEGDRPAQAHSNPETGEIYLTAALLRAIETDAERAFILSHELAHLWFKHPLFEGVPAAIQRGSAWQTQARQCYGLHQHLRVHHWAAEENALRHLERQSSLSAAQRQAKDDLTQALRQRQLALQAWLACTQQQQQLVDRLLGEPGAAQNWTEAEADAVGLVLFLNAGFDPAILPDLFHRTKGINPEDCPSQPNRGSDSHPTPCWRLRQLQHRLGEVRARSAQRRAIARQGQLWRFLPDPDSQQP